MNRKVNYNVLLMLKSIFVLIEKVSNEKLRRWREKCHGILKRLASMENFCESSEKENF